MGHGGEDDPIKISMGEVFFFNQYLNHPAEIPISLLPCLLFSRPHMYFNGHDHILAHLKVADVPNVNFFTSGAAGIADPADLVANKGSKSPTYASNYLFNSAAHGFAIVQLYKDRVRHLSLCDCTECGRLGGRVDAYAAMVIAIRFQYVGAW